MRNPARTHLAPSRGAASSRSSSSSRPLAGRSARWHGTMSAPASPSPLSIGSHMTLSGNEPQLERDDSDHAPMISGRGTKIIVSARGAYEAGNLRALIEMMEPDQKLLWKR